MPALGKSLYYVYVSFGTHASLSAGFFPVTYPRASRTRCTKLARTGKKSHHALRLFFFTKLGSQALFAIKSYQETLALVQKVQIYYSL